MPAPSVERNSPDDPALVGSRIVHVPAASLIVTVTTPLVVPASLTWPVATATAPSVGVAVNAGPDPPRTCPATPVMETVPVVALMANGAVAADAIVPLAVPIVNVGVPAAA